MNEDGCISHLEKDSPSSLVTPKAHRNDLYPNESSFCSGSISSSEDDCNGEDYVSSDITNLHGIFQTPSSINSFTKSLASSTPMTSSRSIINHKSIDYKTPNRKRKLFCNNLNHHSSPSSSMKYIPVSSPATSELLKLSDSVFLKSDSSLTFCDESPSNTVSKNKQRNCKNVLCSCSVINSLYLCDANNSENSDEIKLCHDSNSYVDLNFKSFDLLPGIVPLNDSDM